MVLNSNGMVNSLMLANEHLTTASIWEALETAAAVCW